MSASQRKKKSRGKKQAGAETQDAPVVEEDVPTTEDSADVEDSAVTEETSTQQDDPKESMEYWKEQVLRAQADIQNIRRRSEQDVEDRVRRRLEGLLFDLIRVADYMEAALSSIPESIRQAEQADAFLAGIQAIHQALEGVMTGHGMQLVSPAADATFDPELHEAVETTTQEGLDSPQLELLSRGYRLGKTILRPAKVRLVTPQDDSEA